MNNFKGLVKHLHGRTEEIVNNHSRQLVSGPNVKRVTFL